MKPTHDEEVGPLCSRAREHNRTTCTNTVRVDNASPVPLVTLWSRDHQGLLDLVPVHEKARASNQQDTNTSNISLGITYCLNYNKTVILILWVCKPYVKLIYNFIF